jgi:amino acid transporter
VLPRVWSGFQLVGADPSITSASGATNGILLGSVLIALATVTSSVGVRFMALINGIGVTCELTGVVLLLALLFGHAERGPGVVTETLNVSGDSPYLYVHMKRHVKPRDFSLTVFWCGVVVVLLVCPIFGQGCAADAPVVMGDRGRRPGRLWCPWPRGAPVSAGAGCWPARCWLRQGA